MDKIKPVVSIGLPVFNGSNFIGNAIESILAQEFTDFELIICDNASTDDTSEICQTYAAKDKRIRYYRHKKNLGATRNFNSTFEKSTGQYFKWASHDDLLCPQYLNRCLAFLKKNKQYVLCWPTMNYIDERGELIKNQSIDNLSVEGGSFLNRIRRLFNYQISGDDIVPSIFGLIPSAVLRKTNLWQRFTSSEEVLMLELLLQGEIKQLDTLQFHFRVHKDSAFHKNRTPEERAKWFDTEKKSVLQLPVWYLFFRYLGVVKDSELGFLEKMACYYQIFRRAVYLWRRYFGDLVKYFGQFVGFRHLYKGAPKSS
jgi:glycosyltransferase involved in cell wall biosynthesis